jgi:hypothetical protein
MQQKKKAVTSKLSNITQQEIDSLTIDSCATRSRMLDNPSQFMSSMDALNARRVEINSTRLTPAVEPGPSELLKGSEPESGWVN